MAENDLGQNESPAEHKPGLFCQNQSIIPVLTNGNNSPEAILALQGTDEMLSNNRKWATVSQIPEQSGKLGECQDQETTIMMKPNRDKKSSRNVGYLSDTDSMYNASLNAVLRHRSSEWSYFKGSCQPPTKSVPKMSMSCFEGGPQHGPWL